MACPICKHPVPPETPHRPFCCKRCKQVDLGRWLGEEYKISRPLNLEEVRELQDRTLTEDRPSFS